MTSTKKLKEMFNVNSFSHSIFIKYLIKSMIKIKKGSIIYVSSSSALDEMREEVLMHPQKLL